MSGENVRITFDSYMYDTDEHIQVSATGVHSIKDGMHYVIYTEQVEGGQSVRNILKFDGEALEVSSMYGKLESGPAGNSTAPISKFALFTISAN